MLLERASDVGVTILGGCVLRGHADLLLLNHIDIGVFCPLRSLGHVGLPLLLDKCALRKSFIDG